MWDWFFQPFADQTWWDILNSSIVATTLSAIVGIIVAGRVGQVAMQTKEATAEATRTRHAMERAEDETAAEAAEVASAPAEGQIEARARFHRAATAIRALKDYVDARASRVADGRVRRKYDNIPRRDYREIIKALEADGGLAGDELKELRDAFERWRSFRTGKQTVFERMMNDYEALADKYKVTPKKPARWRPERARSVQW
jgi:hypothetical protein